jgi:hypothetical protein
MLRAIAEVNGLALTSNVARLMVEQLAVFLSDPAQVGAVLAECSPAASDTLATLLRDGGRSLRLVFERQHGAIRAVGPGRLEREKPHLSPITPSEELWYRGLIYSAFSETPAGMAEFLYLPGEIAALLPAPEPAPDKLHLPICLPPEAIHPASDGLLQDLCTLLCFVQTGQVRLVVDDDSLSWQRTSLYELNRYLLQPLAGSDESLRAGPGHPLALALALAKDMDWLMPRRRRRLALHAQAVSDWLAASRDRQQRLVMEAWQGSQTWNDLCRTPSLLCEETGGWRNDPAMTRARLLPQFAQLEPGVWHEQESLVAALKASTPDFQRPDGVYDTWYIRERESQTYLRGFDYWDSVEGALLRFLVAGPLHWLGVVDLGFSAPRPVQEDLALATQLASTFSVTRSGHAWLNAQPAPAAPTPGGLTVLSDYTVLVPADAPLGDRFRVSRFTTWEPAPQQTPAAAATFQYRITRSGLSRAAEQGIDAPRVLTFLQEHSSHPVPGVVIAGLERWRPT